MPDNYSKQCPRNGDAQQPGRLKHKWIKNHKQSSMIKYRDGKYQKKKTYC